MQSSIRPKTLEIALQDAAQKPKDASSFRDPNGHLQESPGHVRPLLETF